jgi:hypothetical protein
LEAINNKFTRCKLFELACGAINKGRAFDDVKEASIQLNIGILYRH